MNTLRRPFPALRRPVFGRGRRYVLGPFEAKVESLSDDARLFLTTFMGGFLFMAVYLA